MIIALVAIGICLKYPNMVFVCLCLDLLRRGQAYTQLSPVPQAVHHRDSCRKPEPVQAHARPPFAST